MGFWSKIWGGFGKSMVSAISTPAIEEAVRAAKEEIDELPKLKVAEKTAMKAGVDLLRQRVEQYLSENVK